MADDHDVIPLVLAAGRGRRLGGNKAALDLAGTPALVKVLETARAAGTGRAIVVVGHESERVRALLAGRQHEKPVAGDIDEPAIVENPDPERGQTSSVQVGLAEVPLSAAVLIWPVDHALVGVDDVTALLAGARAHPEAPVVLPSHRGRAGHPAFVRRSLFPAIFALEPGEPLHTVLRAERDRTHFVERPTDSVLRDLDTPADLAAVRRGAAKDRSISP